jgi:hypothetical protein
MTKDLFDTFFPETGEDKKEVIKEVPKSTPKKPLKEGNSKPRKSRETTDLAERLDIYDFMIDKNVIERNWVGPRTGPDATPKENRYCEYKREWSDRSIANILGVNVVYVQYVRIVGFGKLKDRIMPKEKKSASQEIADKLNQLSGEELKNLIQTILNLKGE